MLINGSPDALHPVTLGGLSAAVSDADIADYISTVLNTVGLTDEQKAAQILDAAEMYGVTIQDISRSTGYSVNEVTDYLNQAIPQQQVQAFTSQQITSSPTIYEGDYYAPIISSVTVEPEKNTSSGVSFAEVKRVLDMYLTNTQIDDQHRAYVVAGYMRDKNISVNEVAEIMGYSPIEVTNYLAIAYQPPSFDSSVAKIVGESINAEKAADTAAKAAATAAQLAKNAAAIKASQEAAAKAAQAAAAAAAAVAKAKATAAAEAAAKAKQTSTMTTIEQQATSQQTGISSAMPLILAAAAAYFLGA